MQQFDFSEDELDFIERFDNRDSSYWDSDSPHMQSIKRKIKQSLLSSQNQTCCYCKMYKQENHGAVWDVEHVFPKALYPKFTFLDKNLAVACKECNTAKNDFDVRKNKNTDSSRMRYPTTGTNINIIHPMLDTYEDHIHIKRFMCGSILHAPIKGSLKGKNTFHQCNFYRFLEDTYGPNNRTESMIADRITDQLNRINLQELSKESIKPLVETIVHMVCNAQ
ncbi:HNH endonuclease [Acinetobacter rathckeae]|uniref:HNH endonuclease n=1 Tax=Acinetobacter rathckeae TaxID=2605272 RepID=UPI0018A33089|nr:hypothetical protein [Acinetobacter rathckeae]MBF7696200.1 hypothetical protein [Acinetobacter rathckeae]